MRSFLVGLSLSVLAACGSASDLDTGADISSVAGTVLGTVQAPAGAPVAGATVRAVAYFPYASGLKPVAGDSMVTRADGRYRLVLAAPLTPAGLASLVLHVTAPSGGGLADADTTGLTLRLGGGLDSARVDFRLAPATP